MGPPIPLTIPPGDTGSQAAEMYRGPISLATLMSLNPEAQMQQVFTTEATIVHIDEQRGWYFDRCRTCHTKIENGLPHWHCHQVGTKPAPNYSYCLQLVLQDTTGEIPMTCFSPSAHTLLPPCDEVVNYIPEPNPYILPPVIRDLLNTTHVFQLHLGTGSRRGYPRFVLDNATDSLPPLLPPIPPPQQEGTSSSASKPIIQETIDTSTPGGTIPPPPTTAEATEKIADTPEKVSATVRKQLFPPDEPESPEHEVKKLKRE